MVDVAVRLFATRSENLTEAGSPVPFLGGSRVGLRPIASSRERGGKAAAQVVGGIPPACVNRASSVLRCRTLKSRRGLLAGRSGRRSSSLSSDYLTATVNERRCSHSPRATAFVWSSRRSSTFGWSRSGQSGLGFRSCRLDDLVRVFPSPECRSCLADRVHPAGTPGSKSSALPQIPWNTDSSLPLASCRRPFSLSYRFSSP